MESLRLENSSKIISPTIPSALPSPPSAHLPICHTQTEVFEHFQGWGLHHCPEQVVPVPDYSFHGGIFPNIPPRPLLLQLKVISSDPWEQSLAPPSYLKVAECKYLQLDLMILRVFSNLNYSLFVLGYVVITYTIHFSFSDNSNYFSFQAHHFYWL